MPVVKFTAALKRFFPSIEAQQIDAQNVREALHLLDRRYPGLAHYLADEQGCLRSHINIYVDNHLIVHRDTLADSLLPDSELLIMQALSGG